MIQALRWLGPAVRDLAEVVLPRRCHFCRAFLDPEGAGELICPECQAALERPGSPACLVCGMPFVSPVGLDRVCGDCQDQSPPFTAARFVAVYQDPLARAIKDFKYNRRLELVRSLGSLLAAFQPGSGFPDRFDLILPVPLHPQRLRWRGFNQAAVLARHLTRLGPVETDLLIRTRNTPPQTTLKGRERRLNVKGAFALTDPKRVAGRRILVVDDLWTTGATIDQCARTLTRAKAAQVAVLTLSRALRR